MFSADKKECHALENEAFIKGIVDEKWYSPTNRSLCLSYLVYERNGLMKGWHFLAMAREKGDALAIASRSKGWTAIQNRTKLTFYYGGEKYAVTDTRNPQGMLRLVREEEN